MANRGGGKKAYPYEFCDKTKRLLAAKDVPKDLATKDPLLSYMIKNMETLYQPKMVTKDDDWLVT